MAQPDPRDSNIAPLFTRLSSAVSDRYRIERELGAGGMATVYLAADLRHRRNVAVKVLRPELAATLGPDRLLHDCSALVGDFGIALAVSNSAGNRMTEYLPAVVPHANYDESPDGAHLLVLKGERQRLLVVHNWGVEARARLRNREQH
jgi:hypothetical protein